MQLPATMEGWLSLCFIAVSTPLALWLVKASISGGKNKPAKKQKLPPGPWSLPVIGSLHHLIGALPHRRMMELSHRHGPVMLLKLGEVPSVIVSNAEVAKMVLNTKNHMFADRPHGVMLDIASFGGRGIAIAPYGDHWRQVHNLCVMELLSSKQVGHMEGIRAGEVGGLLRYVTAAASTGATVNVSEKTMELSNDVLSLAVFGSKFTQKEEFMRELGEVLTLLGGLSLVDLFPSSRLLRWLSASVRRMERSYGRIHSIINDIIDGRKAARASGDGVSSTDDEDLLDVLLRLQQGDTLEIPLTTETIGALITDMFEAATKSTGSLLAWAMSELVHNPDTMAKAQQEVREVLGEDRTIITNSDLAKLPYIRMVINETLRLHPPGPLVPRLAREDCTIMGSDIPKGTGVLINVFAICQDTRYWNNPEEFKPERFDNNNVNYNGTHFEFIPFGAGRRLCPGMLFGMSIVDITLANLLYHFDWMLPDGASLDTFDMSEKFGVAVTRKKDLQLRAIPHVWSKAAPSK